MAYLGEHVNVEITLTRGGIPTWSWDPEFLNLFHARMVGIRAAAA